MSKSDDSRSEVDGGFIITEIIDHSQQRLEKIVTLTEIASSIQLFQKELFYKRKANQWNVFRHNNSHRAER